MPKRPRTKHVVPPSERVERWRPSSPTQRSATAAGNKLWNASCRAQSELSATPCSVPYASKLKMKLLVIGWYIGLLAIGVAVMLNCAPYYLVCLASGALMYHSWHEIKQWWKLWKCLTMNSRTPKARRPAARRASNRRFLQWFVRCGQPKTKK